METNQSSSSPIQKGPEAQPQQVNSKNNNLLAVIVVSVLLTGAITGSIVYFWQKLVSDKAINNLEQKIASLEKQISILKEAKIETQSTSFPSPTSTSNWKTFTSKTNYYSLKYPNTWTFRIYDKHIYKDYATFTNRIENTDLMSRENPSDHVFGEIKIMTTEAVRGTKWASISKKEFLKPTSKFWIVGDEVGGGPGYSQATPLPIDFAGKSAMLQITHPSKEYEFVYPQQITKNYYVYLGGTNNELLIVTFTYDDRSVNKNQVLNEFDQILSTFKFTD